MNALKKVLSCLLALTMVLSMATTVAFAGESMATFSLESPESAVKVGDTFTIPVKITENKSIASITMNTKFDQTAFRLDKIDFTNKEVFSGCLFGGQEDPSNAKYGKWLITQVTNSADTGLLVELTFTVLDAATVGDYTINLEAEELYDEEYNDLDCTIVPATVTVADDEPTSSAKIVVGYTTEDGETKYNEIDDNCLVLQAGSQDTSADCNWPMTETLYVMGADGNIIEDIDWNLDDHSKIWWNNESSYPLTASSAEVRGNTDGAKATLTATLPDESTVSIEVTTKTYANTVSAYNVASEDTNYYSTYYKALIVDTGATFTLSPTKVCTGTSTALTEDQLANNTLTYASGDESILTVDAKTGEYTVVGKGETTIYMCVAGQEHGKNTVAPLKAINVYCGDAYAQDLRFSENGTLLEKDCPIVNALGNTYYYAQTSVAVGKTQEIALTSIPTAAIENITVSSVTSASTANVTVENDNGTLKLTGVAVTEDPVQVKVQWKRTNVSTVTGAFVTSLYVNVTEGVDYTGSKIVVGYPENGETKYYDIDDNHLVLQTSATSNEYDYSWPIAEKLYVMDKDGNIVENVSWDLDDRTAIYFNTSSEYPVTGSYIEVGNNGTDKGTGTVTATLPDGSELTVEVEAKAYINTVTSYTLNSEDTNYFAFYKRTLIVDEGAKFTLVPFGLYVGRSTVATDAHIANNKLVYVSGDESILTVDAETGEYTVVGEGETTISLSIEGQEHGQKKLAPLKEIKVFCGSKYPQDLVIAQNGTALEKTYEAFAILNAETTVNAGETQEFELAAVPTASMENISIDTVTSEKTANVTAAYEDGKLKVTGVAATTTPVRVKVSWQRTNVSTYASTDYFTTNLYVNVTAADVAVTSVTLDQESLNLVLGDTETATLTATVSPEDATDKSVTWSSSNEEVATVDENGVVTAVAAGTATITATAGNDVSASCAVTVKEIEYSIAKTDKTIAFVCEEGATIDLSEYIEVEPEDAAVTWDYYLFNPQPIFSQHYNESRTNTSLANGVLTINNTAIANYLIPLKAVMDDDSEQYITLTLLPVMPGIDTEAVEMSVGDTHDAESISVNANNTNTYWSMNYTYSWTWSSSDEEVATVDENGNVTAVGAGEATITATEACGAAASYTVTVAGAEPTPTPEPSEEPTPEPTPEPSEEPIVTINEDHADMNVSAETVTEGETVQLKLSIENDVDASSKYNSYEFHVSYDPELLSYESVSCSDGENCAVTETGAGSLIINGYGADKTVSEDAFVTLTFKTNEVSETTDTDVKLNAAYRDTSAGAIDTDIDEIEVETSTKTITIENVKASYKVSFSETVKVNGEEVDEVTVTEGESVTFEVIEKSGHTYTVDGATKNTDGSYTVTPTDDTTVTITHTAKTYDVTVEGSGKDDVTASASATYGKAYSFTLNKDASYNYSVSVKVGGNTVSATESDGTYTISADDVTGAIVITVTKEAKAPAKTEYTVTLYENGVANAATEKTTEGEAYAKSATEGYKIYKVVMNEQEISSFTAESVSIASVTGNIEIYMGKIYDVTLPEDNTATGESSANYGSDYTFTVEDGYQSSATVDGEDVDLTENEDGSYTIDGETITGEIVISTEKIVYVGEVNVYDYVKAEDATLIQLVVATAKEGALSDGEILQYNGANMFWSEKYNGYAYLIAVAADEDKLTAETASANIGKASATATSISYAGDVNKTGITDINDAQLVYDIYKALYNDFSTVSMEKMLRADMNADHEVNVSDARAVASIVNQ